MCRCGLAAKQARCDGVKRRRLGSLSRACASTAEKARKRGICGPELTTPSRVGPAPWAWPRWPFAPGSR